MAQINAHVARSSLCAVNGAEDVARPPATIAETMQRLQSRIDLAVSRVGAATNAINEARRVTLGFVSSLVAAKSNVDHVPGDSLAGSVDFLEIHVAELEHSIANFTA